MVTRSILNDETKSVRNSSIVTEYLNFNLNRKANAWIQSDSRNEKLIGESLTGPLVELIHQEYDSSKEINVYVNINKQLQFFLKWHNKSREHVFNSGTFKVSGERGDVINLFQNILRLQTFSLDANELGSDNYIRFITITEKIN